MYGRRGKRRRDASLEDADDDADEEEGADRTTGMPSRDDVQRTPLPPSKSHAKKLSPLYSSRHQQMTLDLGQKLRIECATCGMSYDRSDPADTAMHRRFHADATQGVAWRVRGGRCLAVHRLPAATRKRLSDWGDSRSASGADDGTAEVWSYDVSSRTNQDGVTMRALQQVQDRMDAALGAVGTTLGGGGAASSSTPRRTMLVAVWRQRVIGSGLFGPMSKESVRRVTASASSSDAVVVDSDPLPLENAPPLGVHRIYVVPGVRRSGLAFAMLEAALDSCVYGLSGRQVVEQYGRGLLANAVAFSQPTQSGRMLAESWISKPRDEGGDLSPTSSLLVFEDST